jgi:membrane protein YqaA with SNARE-associated domain
MRLFSPLYARVMTYARHRHAPWWLALLSFAESSFFPIPPDVMLAPMALAQPQRAWWLALVTTVASVVGGLFGYAIGWGAFASIEPWLAASRYWPAYETAREWFAAWGAWAVFVAGFSPIPYKVFTIAAGVMQLAIVPFLIASLIGRGARFYLVAGLMVLGGARLEAKLHRWIDALGWVTVAVLVLAYLWYRWR